MRALLRGLACRGKNCNEKGEKKIVEKRPQLGISFEMKE